MQKRYIFLYIILIIIVLAVIYLSQQANSREFGKTLISNATNQAAGYLASGASWVSSNVYSKIGGEVQKRGNIISNEIDREKNKVSENIGTKISNYFSGIANSILHPGQNNNCVSPPAQTSPTN